jgi:hypothetical protein
MQKTRSGIILSSLLLVALAPAAWAEELSSKSVVEQIVDAQTPA